MEAFALLFISLTFFLEIKGRVIIMKKFIYIILFFGLLISCSNQDDHWRKSPLISVDDVDYHGTDQIFGMTKMNGDPDEPSFQKGLGRLYQLTFFDQTEKLVGKTYTLTGFHEETGETVELYRDEIQGENAAKLSLDKSGFWKIEVFVDEKLYTSFVVDVV